MENHTHSEHALGDNPQEQPEPKPDTPDLSYHEQQAKQAEAGRGDASTAPQEGSDE